LVREVLLDIADEEKVHAGEFLRLLMELDDKEFEFYKEEYAEVTMYMAYLFANCKHSGILPQRFYRLIKEVKYDPE
jgi:rubrerythrin